MEFDDLPIFNGNCLKSQKDIVVISGSNKNVNGGGRGRDVHIGREAQWADSMLDPNFKADLGKTMEHHRDLDRKCELPVTTGQRSSGHHVVGGSRLTIG